GGGGRGERRRVAVELEDSALVDQSTQRIVRLRSRDTGGIGECIAGYRFGQLEQAYVGPSLVHGEAEVGEAFYSRGRFTHGVERQSLIEFSTLVVSQLVVAPTTRSTSSFLDTLPKVDKIGRAHV